MEGSGVILGVENLKKLSRSSEDLLGNNSEVIAKADKGKMKSLRKVFHLVPKIKSRRK